jgi:opacity protein-like surface antigen
MNYSMKKLNYKQYLPLVSALAIVVPTSGNTVGSIYKSGVYTGASVGYTYMNTKVNDNMDIPDDFAESKVGRMRSHTINGEVFLGYRHFFTDGWLGGLEVGLSKDNASISKAFQLDDFKTNSTLKSSYKIIPTFILGKQLNERWLGFIKLGMSYAHFKGKHSYSVDTERVETFKAKKTGLMLGAGAEYALNAHLSTIAMVAYERFGSIKRQYKNTSPVIGEKNTGSFKPSYVTAKIGLAYRF